MIRITKIPFPVQLFSFFYKALKRADFKNQMFFYLIKKPLSDSHPCKVNGDEYRE